MQIYTIKIWVEESPEVYRELAVPGNITYEQLHLIMIKIFGIEQRMPASFFQSNKRWQKLKEIAVDQHRILEGSRDGAELTLEETYQEEVRQLVYFNDATTHVNFLLQIEGSFPKEKDTSYPRLIQSKGKIVRGFGEGIFDEELDWDEDMGENTDGFSEDPQP